MTDRCFLAALAVLLGAAVVHAADKPAYPGLSGRIPHFVERLNSNRWQVRYCLVGELRGRDAETKRALEQLARDGHANVANQALVVYQKNFLAIDRSVFDPEKYLNRKLFDPDLSREEAHQALVDHCLGRVEHPRERGLVAFDNCMGPPLPALDPKSSDDPNMCRSLTIVGILGEPDDAAAVLPFAGSRNDYVALAAARALLRLGDRANGEETLLRIVHQVVRSHLFYITEALYVLHEIAHPRFRECALRVLAAVDRDERIQPNWVSHFILLASLAKEDVWNR